jgi:hypothetical protein
MRRSIRTWPQRGSCLALLLTVCSQPVQSEETIGFGTLGVTAALPAEWTGTVTHTQSETSSPGYNTLLKAACQSETCKRSLDTCSIWLFDKLTQRTDQDALAIHVSSARRQYEFTRTALIHSGPDARVAKTVDLETLGKAFWYVIETQSSGAYKSVLRAETVIDGRHMVAECRTCLRDSHRFNAARTLLSSVAIAPSH